MQALFSSAWPYESKGDYRPILERADGYVAAFDDGKLVGFVKIITDAGLHAFLLDTSVHQHWLHVDFEPHLESFYASCGFAPTQAGLIRLAE
jgi:hypothetical protein